MKRAKTEQGEPRKVSFADLGQTEQDVMVQLAQQRTTNLPALAAGLWRITPDWQAFDPYPLLAYVLDSLASRGLVSFRLALYSGERIKQANDIRLSPHGWALMGFPNKVVEIGTRDRHQAAPVKTKDGTNYRNQPFRALGGPIETHTFPQHRALYPHHIHMYDGDIQVTDQSVGIEAGDMTRPYTRVSPEMEASVIHARDKLGMVGYADIAERTGVPERTVKYILVDLPRLRRVNAGDEKAEGSLKKRVMAAVEGVGQIRDVPELRRILGMADDEHSVLHVLHSLHTQGRIDFTERGNGMGNATVVNIRLPKKGKKNDIVNADIPFEQQPLPVLTKDQEAALINEHAEAVRKATEELGKPPVDATGVEVTIIEPEATTLDTPVTAPSAPESEGEGYPLLDALLERERKRLEQDGKAMAYVNAAEAVMDLDKEMYDVLMAKAAALDIVFPSPIEQEYIRFVAAHPNSPVHDLTEDHAFGQDGHSVCLKCGEVNP